MKIKLKTLRLASLLLAMVSTRGAGQLLKNDEQMLPSAP
jgi:hypothetical protein